MTTTTRRLVLAACVAVLFGARGEAAPDPVLGPGGRSPALVVPAWYATARTAPTSPLMMTRVLAIVHAAMHDAVNGADPRYETYASDLSDPSAAAEAAAAAAAHRVLAGLFPADQARWDAALADSLANIPDGAPKDAGVALGGAVGQVILDVRADDGWDSVDPFDPIPGPGVWTPTPPGFTPMAEPQFQNVTPFAVESRDQFPVPPPPALATREYARVFEQVRSIGRDSSRERTPDQTHVAHFWYEPPYDSWSRIAGILQAQKGHDLHETARLYALVNMVICDSFSSGWYWKRQHAFWRPITAIWEADTDGNPHTHPDPGWNSLRIAPSHPDHPSTHSIGGGAAAEVMRRVVGSDHQPFCMTTLTAIPAGSLRCFQTFSQAQEENLRSRVFAGIHFRTATDAGDRLGRSIGRFAIEHVLRPLPRSRRR